MSALFDELDELIVDHDCPATYRVHTMIDGQFSSYACPRCVDDVVNVALKHLPTATDVTVSVR